MNTAIIVAAGKGKRFQSDRPKQFLQVLGKPIIIHTLQRFERCPAIDEIILVLAEAEIEDFSATVHLARLKKLTSIVAGGESRAESVRNGFEAVNKSSAIVAVHDGARPLVSTDEIARTVEAAEKIGAACLAAPVTDTIKTIEGTRITGTIDRSQLRRALTPQAFRYEILRQALSQGELDESITDECSLIEKMGLEIACVVGRAGNIKITHPADLIAAEHFLRDPENN